MIFTNLKIDNFYGFVNAELSLSIKKKIISSTINDENLINYPNFRFKKVCIISGSNSSGKTALGYIMRFIENMLIRNIFDSVIFSKVNNKSQKATLVAEFYSNDHLHEISITYFEEKLSFRVRVIKLKSNDTYYQANKRLQVIKTKPVTDVKKYFSDKINPGWLYLLTDNDNSDSNKISDIEYLNNELLYNVMHSFDSSITSVDPTKDSENKIAGFKVNFANQDHILIDTEANPTDKNRLSTGTYHSIKIAYFIGRIIQDYKNKCSGNIYFLDEAMAYIHSNLEQAIVNLIIEKLPSESQFFYTTHNYDVLDMNLPVHSFVFLQKTGEKTDIVNAEKKFNKNDRRLFSYVKNNFFNSLPNTDLIDELL